MIDIGANLTNRAFHDDLDSVLQRARAAGITGIVVTGTDLATSHAGADLADREPGFLACTAGVHPHDAKDVPPGWLDELETLLARPAVKAVGETGLDFHRNYSPPEAQRRVFDAQIELAVGLDRPLFVHDRETDGEVLERLAAYAPAPHRVVIHCFTGSATELEAYLGAGYLIGITGWVCDERRGTELRELVSRIPSAQLMIESDAPYLLPRSITPRPKSRRNEPAHLSWVARGVAEARGESLAAVSIATAENARRFFGL